MRGLAPSMHLSWSLLLLVAWHLRPVGGEPPLMAPPAEGELPSPTPRSRRLPLTRVPSRRLIASCRGKEDPKLLRSGRLLRRRCRERHLADLESGERRRDRVDSNRGRCVADPTHDVRQRGRRRPVCVGAQRRHRQELRNNRLAERNRVAAVRDTRRQYASRR